MAEGTLKQIGTEAEARAQLLLDQAREANRSIIRCLEELDASPLFVNGLGRAFEESHKGSRALDERLENMKKMVRDHFRSEPREE